jgi:hypothetical protein
MADIINLRRARKSKARTAKTAGAEVNRVQHGIAKPLRVLAKARRDKDARAVDVHKMDDK